MPNQALYSLARARLRNDNFFLLDRGERSFSLPQFLFQPRARAVKVCIITHNIYIYSSCSSAKSGLSIKWQVVVVVLYTAMAAQFNVTKGRNSFKKDNDDEVGHQ